MFPHGIDKEFYPYEWGETFPLNVMPVIIYYNTIDNIRN